MQSFPASLKLLYIHLLGAALTLTSLLIITLLASPLKQSNILKNVILKKIKPPFKLRPY